MSIDYGATYGIGVKLAPIEIEDIEEYLEDLVKGTPYFYESGGDHLTGDISYYLYIKNPDENTFKNLPDKIIKFIKFLKDNKVGYEGKVNVTGEYWVS
jgi:hypothetical protein